MAPYQFGLVWADTDYLVHQMERRTYTDMKVYDSYTNTFYDNSKKQDVIASDKTIPLGDELLDKIKAEIKFITDSNGVNHIHRNDVFEIIDKYKAERRIPDGPSDMD